MLLTQLTAFFGSGIGIIILLLLIINAVMWFFLPFMVNGLCKSNKAMKELNKELLTELKSIRVLMQEKK